MTVLLERVRLKTFGCFQQRDFELSKGINLIFGPNFSGKSTLVNAIFFTLTGKPIVPRVDAAAIKSAKAFSGTAGLQFVVNDETYLLFRGTRRRFQLRQKQDEAWHIVFDDKRVKVVEDMLKEKFGIMHDRLALTAFLREGEIFEFLARQPSTRRDILYTLLGIDKLIEVRERFIDARRLAKRERGRIQSHQNSMRYNASNPNKTEIENIETRLKKLETAYSMETGDAELIAEWKKNREQIQKQVEKLTTESSETLSGFTDLNQLQEMIKTIEEAVEKAKGIEKEREILIQKIGSHNSQITAITNVCNTLKTLLENGDGHCPTCQQKIEREIVKKIIQEKDTDKVNLTKELQTFEKTLSEQTDDLQSRKKLEQRLQILKTCATRLEQIAQEIDKYKTEITKLTTQLNNKGMSESTTETHSDESFAQLDKGQVKKQIDSDRKKLQKLKQDEAVQLDRLKRLQKVNLEAEQVESTTLSLELACAGVEKTIDTLQRQILKPAEKELHHWLEEMKLFQKGRIDLQRQHLLPSIQIDGEDRSLMLLSGSEKMFLYLCFKVALSKVLGNTGFFVLDDPTLHLDGERKALMVDFIRQLAEEHQVIITSYDEDVRSGLEGANVIEMKREQ
ncbi:AAA family ATPase [Candidatus Poribacteria bacterium]|nr:AAA family ATPase [Candidatus Poribacteria bacterium]MYB63122.1 AAA family ATPase [Candidatus Poribacteria bacterium]